MAVKDVYAIWNNKGGVGKSTIAFHVSSLYANSQLDTNVLVIDMCPQANASMMLLGGGQNGETELLNLCDKPDPTSVVGYLSDALSSRRVPNFRDYVVQVSGVNNAMPKNLWLMPGDGNLELMAPAIVEEAKRTPLIGHPDPWAWVHLIFERLAKQLEQDAGDWVIFFDTNPSFAIYTELAICGSRKLIVPANADDSSRVATKALFALLYGSVPPHPFFGGYTFAAFASEKIKIPKVHLVVGNRFTQYKGAASAYLAFSDATGQQLFDEYRHFPSRFSPRPARADDLQAFLQEFVVELRDFNTAGVVAAHHGTPLYGMRQDYYPVHDDPEVKVNRSQIRLGLDAVQKLLDRL